MKKVKKNQSPKTKSQTGELRRRAEKLLAQKGIEPTVEDVNDYRSLVQELQVYQIKLELQDQELQQAHLEAETARHKYFDLYDLSPVGYATFSQNGEILEINLTGAKLLGQERKFLVNRRFQLFVAPEDIPTFNRFNQSVFHSGHRESCELRLVNNGARLAEVRLEGIRSESRDEKGPLCQATLIDVTEQKQLERNFQETQNRYQTLVEASPGVIFETDTRGKSTFVSDRWTQWTGITQEETVGRDWFQGLPPGDAVAAEAPWKEVRANDTFYEYRHRLRAADGSYRWVLVSALPSRDREGNIVRWIGTLTDVDDIARAEELLKAQKNRLEKRLEAVMEALPIGLVITDRQGGGLEFNRAYKEIWGATPPDVRSVEDYSPFKAWWANTGKVLAPEEWASAQAILEEQAVVGQVLEIERFDGSRTHVINSAAPIRDSAGRVIGSAVAIQDISELRKSQEALRTKEAELSLVLNAIPGLIAYVNRDARYRWVNQNYARWFGRALDEIKGLQMADLLGEVQWQEVRPRVEKVLTGETVAYERLLVLPGGETRWVSVNYVPDLDEEGRVQGFVIHVIDIEEIKRNEEALRASEEKYRRILETANEGIVIGSLDGKIRFVNQKLADMLGYSKDELLGQRGLNFIVEAQKAEVLETREKLLKGGQDTREFKFRRKDGSELWTLCSSSQFKDQDGSFFGYLAMHVDITERKRMEKALRENESKLRGILNSVQESIWLFDAEGTVLQANTTALSHFPLLDGEVVGRTMSQILPPDLSRSRMGWLREVFESARPLEFEDQRANFLFHHTFYPIFDESEKVKSVVSFSRDVTESRRAEQALRESEQRFRLALHNTPISVAVQDRDLRFVWAYNQRTARPEETIGKFDADIFTPEEAAHLTAVKRRVLDEGIELREQMWFDRPSGRMFLDVFWEPIRDEAGRVIGVGSATVDLTALKLSEESLRQSQEDLARAQEVGQMGSWRLDVIRNILTWSDVNYRIFGLPQGTPLTYETFLGTVHPDDRQYVDTRWRAGLAGAPYNMEHRIVADGKVKWVREKAYLEFDPAGNLLGGFGITQDITERKQAEIFTEAIKNIEELMLSSLDFDKIMENALSKAAESIGCETAAVSLLTDEDWQVHYAYRFPRELIGSKMNFDEERHALLAIKTKKPVAINDAFNDERVNREHMKKWNIRAVLVVPLFIKKEPVGAIFFNYHKSTFAFQDIHLTFVTQLAYAISLALENTQLFKNLQEELRERNRAEEAVRRSEARFRLLSETAGALLAASSPQRIVEELCTRVMEHLDCQVFFNFLKTGPGDRLHLNAYAGVPEEEARKIEWLDYGVAVCGCAARDRKRIVAEDIFRTPDPRTDLVKSYGVQAYACHPLITQDRLLGTLSFGTKTRSSFSSQDLELMKTVTDQVAVAMVKIRLLETIQAGRDELEVRVRERTAELEKANLSLAEQSRILESFFKDTITPLVFLDRDFNFIRVNEAYARVCQRTVSDFPGHNHFEFFPHEENEAIFRQVVESGIPHQASAKPFSFPDHPEWGVTYWDWILTPLPDDRGETAFLVFSLEDVTDRQQAEEALRLSERQLRVLADQLLHTQENERKRIARDMHDSLGSSLSAFKYRLEHLAHTISEKEPRQIEETLRSLIPILQETIGETRRIQNDLRPPLLDDLGILPTLTWISRQFIKSYSGIVVEQELKILEEEVPELLKVVIFRITQEALNNIKKHAQATLVRMFLGREQDRLKLVIQDNGKGFDTKRSVRTVEQASGMGLSSMKERAELSEGFFSVKSHPGQGTAIEVFWPLKGDTKVE
jgi:PAS domain S-box-containing protein